MSGGPTLEERIRRLEDERDILRTLYMYGHAIDYGYEAEFLDCWAEGAVLRWPFGEPMVGHEAIGAAFRNHTHAPTAWHKHVLVAPIVRIEGDRAHVDSIFERLDPYEDGPQIKSFGRYRDVLVRCADGRWRFQERVAELEANRPQ